MRYDCNTKESGQLLRGGLNIWPGPVEIGPPGPIERGTLPGPVEAIPGPVDTIPEPVMVPVV